MKKNLGAIRKTESLFEIHIAVTQQEKEAIFHFRYQIYVEEMEKSVEHADYKNHSIYDAMDDFSTILYALSDDNEIIGTLRVTFAPAEKFPQEISNIFHMPAFENICGESNSNHLALSTKLAIQNEYRSSTVLYLLLAKAYEIARQRKIQFNFGGANPYMLPLYEQMGYRQYTKNFTDPGYGLLIPLVMVVEDIDHFRAVHSPFYRLGRNLPNNPLAAQLFEERFPAAGQSFNSQLATREDIWLTVSRFLRRPPTEGISLFEGLSNEEAASLLHFGAIFTCSTGDCIMSPGEHCNELFILLSGNLLRKSETGTSFLSKGESFGGTALIHSSVILSESISSLTASSIFVLPNAAYQRFSQKHPKAALCLLANLKQTAAVTTYYSNKNQMGESK